jgi:hypothetical protein
MRRSLIVRLGVQEKSATSGRGFMALSFRSTLPLLVLGVGADHAHDVFAADDLAVLTDAADAAADFHGSPS